MVYTTVKMATDILFFFNFVFILLENEIKPMNYGLKYLEALGHILGSELGKIFSTHS